MIVELINTGSELMLGRVLNTHQQWLCRQLADLGYPVARQVAVNDAAADIEQAVREALGRADLVLTTGGLGPTSDDITRENVAGLLGKTLHEDPAPLANIKSFFELRHRAMPDRMRVQALVPEGARVLPNAHGTAPGLAIEVSPNRFRTNQRSTWLIMLPGPTRELRPMFTGLVVPLLREALPLAAEFVCRTLRTVGLGESMVEQAVAEPAATLVKKGLDLGYCARPGQVDVRLAARGANARQLVQAAEEIVRDRLGRHIFGPEDEDLEAVLVGLLAAKKKTLALAESCTGGALAHRLTNVPGASAVLLAGLVTYSNEAKQRLLGVRADTLRQHGAVSEPVAREMAEGAARQTGADYALSVTGIAGPSGGTPEKPVGTVYIGLTAKEGTSVDKNFNPYDRETFKQVTAQQAMELLRQKLLRTD
jgi:nicotinamide-nucleotide amidase